MPEVTGLGHVGLYVKDPAVMIDFYTNFLGMKLTDRGPDDRIVFLSARPEAEHHELVLFHDESRRTDAQQISFTVGSLADLRAFYVQIEQDGRPVDMVVSHGNAFGCYFRDPEGNQVEVYWPTGKNWPQPYGDKIDLRQSEDELMALVEALGAPAS